MESGSSVDARSSGAMGLYTKILEQRRLAQVRAMRKIRFLDDLEAVEITKDPGSMESALEKASSADE